MGLKRLVCGQEWDLKQCGLHTLAKYAAEWWNFYV